MSLMSVLIVTRLERKGSKRVIYCLDCGHIQAIHNFDGIIPPENTSTGCNYVHYIEGRGAQICLCNEWNDKKPKTSKLSDIPKVLQFPRIDDDNK